MLVLVVPCPGCQSTLKAPESMAGKKAKCKKCGTSFRIPGGADSSGETINDGELLGSMEVPAPSASEASPFDFSAPTPSPSSAPKKLTVPSAKKAAASDQTIVEPLAKKPAEPAAKKSSPDSKPDPKSAPKSAAPQGPVRGKNDDIPMAAPAEEPSSLDELEDLPDEEPEGPPASGDPFSFDQDAAAAPSTAGKSKPRLKAIPKSEAAAEGDTSASPEPAGKGRGYRKKPEAGSGSFTKLLVAVVVFALVLGGVIGGVMIYLNSQKSNDTVSNEKKDDKENKNESVPAEPSATGDAKEQDSASKEKTSKKAPVPKKALAGSAPGSGTLKLAPGHTIQFAPLDPAAAKREAVLAPDRPPLT
ncbi:MAG TPA: hypothetical protein VGL71_00580, partial [Urbifossiella sp.]